MQLHFSHLLCARNCRKITFLRSRRRLGASRAAIPRPFALWRLEDFVKNDLFYAIAICAKTRNIIYSPNLGFSEAAPPVGGILFFALRSHRERALAASRRLL
jgi:hypothetical protein